MLFLFLFFSSSYIRLFICSLVYLSQSCFRLFFFCPPAEVRETKTSLSSTVTGFMKDKDAAEREAKEQRMLVLRVRDQLEASRNSLNQESKIVSQLQKDLEVRTKMMTHEKICTHF